MIFFVRNEGQIVGTFGAALVAVIAAFLTYGLAQYQTNKKEKKYYHGLLHTLKIDLKLKENQLDILKESLRNSKRASVIKKEFVINKVPIQFETTYIESVLSNMIKYESFNKELAAYINAYLYNLRDINFYLDFHTANELIGKLNSDQNIESLISSYYDKLNDEYITKTELINLHIVKLLEIELKE